MTEMFELACQDKLRFTVQGMGGNLTTEDLFDLPLTNANGVSLDSIAITLNKAIKETAEGESFVKTKSKTNKELETKFAIVKRVIEIRLTSAEAKQNAAAKKEKNEQIMRLIADKENDELKGKSLEELKGMLD